MKKFRSVIGFLSIVVLATSCSFGVVPVAATNNEVGSKTGVSKSSYLFGLFPLNNGGGVAAAAKEGGIKKISTVDVQTKSYIIVFDVVTTVTGE